MKTIEDLSLPSWAKGAIAVTVTAGVVFAVYLSYEKVKSLIEDRKRNQEDKAVEDKLKELNDDPKTRQKLSDINIKSMANTIATSFSGIGTDYWAVSTQINRLVNDADFLALKKAFGIRAINSGIYFVPSFRGNLSETIHDEMSADEVLDLNKLLSKKGIKYRL